MPFLPAFGLISSAFTLALLAGASQAEEEPELVLKAFPRAELVHSSVDRDIDHSVVIGGVRRINNQLRAEREVRARGELLRSTFQIPTGHTSAEAFAQAKQQLLDRPNSMLFFCEGRECGSSSLWANQVLDNARLYGPEDNQAYLVLRLDEEPQRFVSLYAITRGNRRAYLHVDQFTPASAIEEALYPTPATLLKVLHADGSVQISLDLQAEPEKAKAWLNLVNRMLRSDTRLRVSVNGEQAPQAVQQLIDLGIRDQRLEIGEPLPATGLRIEKL
ncbi:MAG: DUF4892 domain-containing protein [Pseudomonas sp.]